MRKVFRFFLLLYTSIHPPSIQHPFMVHVHECKFFSRSHLLKPIGVNQFLLFKIIIICQFGWFAACAQQTVLFTGYKKLLEMFDANIYFTISLCDFFCSMLRQIISILFRLCFSMTTLILFLGNSLKIQMNKR